MSKLDKKIAEKIRKILAINPNLLIMLETYVDGMYAAVKKEE